MNIIHTDAYRAAFGAYLRKGTPIRLSLKQAGLTDRCVWRTQRDARVRPAHRRNDGRIFSWADAPDTGHSGEDYNCRCEAVPYIEGQTEFAFFDLKPPADLATAGWDDADFVWHFYTGAGRGVTLAEIGHLSEIIEHYAYIDRGNGAFRRLADQIAHRARLGNLPYPFESHYDFGSIQFSHGDSTVRGIFHGEMTDNGDMLRIDGTAYFEFEDHFTDPMDLRTRPDRFRRLMRELARRMGMGNGPEGPELQIDEDDVSALFMALSEVGGTAYPITDTWEAGFHAEVFKDPTRSQYRTQERAQ